MGPGQLVYEKFGHNAIIIDDAATGYRAAYNYGIFDFGNEDLLSSLKFVVRFLEGTMIYKVQAWKVAETLQLYRDADRSMWIQELNLTAPQKLELLNFLEDNVRPENCNYPYDYYRNNCSTKVRDALDRVLGGQLRQQLERIQTNHTYRFDARRHTVGDPIAYTGIDFIQGHPIDHRLNAWQESFLPMELQAYVRQVKVRNEKGELVPLVNEESELNLSRTIPPPAARPPRWLPYYLACGVALGAAMALLGRAGLRSRLGRAGFGLVSGGWALLVGFAGSFIVLMWFFSSHIAARANENILQFPPAAIPLLILAPAMALRRSWARPVALWLAVALAGLSLLGLALKLAPGFIQPNGTFIALALPADIGLAIGLFFLGKLPIAAAAATQTGRRSAMAKKAGR